MPATNRTSDDDVEEFDAIFHALTGMNSYDAKVGEDGFLFIPPETNLDTKPALLRRRISELAGPNGWRNHLVDNSFAGWWIRRSVK